MKYALIIFLSFCYSCNNFNENDVLKNQDKLLNAIQELKSFEVVRHNDSYDIYTLDSDDIDSYTTEDLGSLSIDYIVKNVSMKNRDFSGFVEENDSLVIFIRRSGNIGDFERRIIYDFSKNPRNFGNESIPGASYELKQLDERWYYSEVGFD